jgi:hydrogenase expression/formation protein HypE
MSEHNDFAPACPIPIQQYPHVLMAHGGGGRLMHQLLEKVFLPAFGGGAGDGHDSTVLDFPGPRLAFTTDSYVVRPVFFPGGDIGSMAVHGTVNDLAMSGARPLWLSAGFILEEGLPMETLWKIVCSMRDAARSCGVRIVTGDTKVVERRGGDGVFINTAGVGAVEHGLAIHPRSVQPGDAVLINGDVGRHGMAVMAVREGLDFESAIESDSAPVWDAVESLLKAGIQIHCLRDTTRGGMAATLNEIATVSRLKITIEETRVPVREDVRAACEILGLDPLNTACEGRFLAFVPESQAEQALAAMRRVASGSESCRIGRVEAADSPMVTVRSSIGAQRILDMPSGEQLPRIC